MNRGKWYLAGLTVLFLSAGAGLADAAHPYHVSYSEVDWNPRTGNFEVAMCVWPADLEQALAKHVDRPVDLDHESKLDKLLKSYISKQFVLRQGQDKRPIRWVGAQIRAKKAWLYFEIQGDAQAGGNWTLRNAIFHELNEDQLNHVQLGLPAGKRQLAPKSGPLEHQFQLGSPK